MKKTGFTLVELVITITILVILSTIAFVSFQSYTQDSRDANRLSSLNEIQKGLTLSYSKNGSFPTPKNATTYTGGTISLLQGILTQEILPELQSDPKDPLSKSSYTYSTTSDGEYFQIASDIENTDVLSQVSLQKTYAKVSSALVKGNYKFDPSLPSLIVIPTTSLTNSGIFSPDNCFVTNGGSNTIGNTTCTTKKQSLLKTTDSSLVGYWDMETLTGAQLLDLSGNGNNAIASGGMVFSNSLTGGIVGNALDFKSSSTGFAYVKHTTSLQQNIVSVSVLVKPLGKNTAYYSLGGYFVSKGIYPNYNYSLGFSDNAVTGNTPILSGKNISYGNLYLLTHTIDFNTSKHLTYINGAKASDGILKTTISSGVTTNIEDVFFGRVYYGNDKWQLYGYLDEIKIYNRALSDKEIEQQAKILGF